MTSGDILQAICMIVAALIPAFAGYFVGIKRPKNKVHVSLRDESFFQEICNAGKICLYTVNSFTWASMFQTELKKVPNISLNEVQVLVRRRDDESQEYLDNLETNINIWKTLYKEGRIKKLCIYGYKNNPDHYYVIIGDSHVLTGLVYEDNSNPSGTTIDYLPIVLPSKARDGEKIIGRYKQHFEKLISTNKGNEIFKESLIA